MSNIQKRSLVAVVCGMPFSGTTFLSRIICSHPLIDSGFECGILFEHSPREFKSRIKFYNWMKSYDPPYNWKLSEEDMLYITDTDNFYEPYDRIVERCHLFKDNDKQFIVDKTPAYIYKLARTMRKVPDTPFIIIKKPLHFQYKSYKARGQSIDKFLNLRDKYNRAITNVLDRPKLKRRLLIVDFDELNQDISATVETIFSFIENFQPIGFSTNMIPLVLSNLENDITSNKKKLRKKYNYSSSRNEREFGFTQEEISKLNQFALLQ
jgi:hypothetical protein